MFEDKNFIEAGKFWVRKDKKQGTGQQLKCTNSLSLNLPEIKTIKIMKTFDFFKFCSLEYIFTFKNIAHEC